MVGAWKQQLASPLSGSDKTETAIASYITGLLVGIHLPSASVLTGGTQSTEPKAAATPAAAPPPMKPSRIISNLVSDPLNDGTYELVIKGRALELLWRGCEAMENELEDLKSGRRVVLPVSPSPANAMLLVLTINQNISS